MTFEERAKRLKNHPDTITVELAGESRPWFLGKVTFDLAKSRGVELGSVISGFDSVDALDSVDDSTGMEQVEHVLNSFGQLLYFGFLPFDESLTEADVTDLLSLGDMQRLTPTVMEAFAGEVDAQAGKAKAAAQGAADRRKRSR